MQNFRLERFHTPEVVRRRQVWEGPFSEVKVMQLCVRYESLQEISDKDGQLYGAVHSIDENSAVPQQS